MDVSDLNYVLETFDWLVTSRSIDYFTLGRGENLCSSWKSCFMKKLDNWEEIISDGFEARQGLKREPLPLSFLCLRQFVSKISFCRRHLITPKEVLKKVCDKKECTTQSNRFPNKFVSLSQKKVKLKKSHEVNRLVELIEQMQKCKHFCSGEIDSVMDIGAGVGHLSRLIALNTNLRVLAIEGNQQFSEAATSFDEQLSVKVSVLKERLPIREIGFVNERLAQKIDGFSIGGAILVGLHACGDLSSTILKVFLNSKKSRELVLAGCCYHKEFDNFRLFGEQSTTSVEYEEQEKARCAAKCSVFPLSEKWKDTKLGYLARELACHNNESNVANIQKIVTGSYSLTARARLETFIVAAAERRDACGLGLCGVKNVQELLFGDYVELAMRQKGKDLYNTVVKFIRKSDPDVLSVRVGEMDNSGVLCMELLRSLIAPLIESAIIDDRMKNRCCSRKSHRYRQNALTAVFGSGLVRSQRMKAPDFEKMMQLANKSEDVKLVNTVYYCSRTHGQLEQVVHELNRTPYKCVKSAVIGSREQFCIHPKVRAIKEQLVQSHVCRGMVSKRTCSYYNRLEGLDSEKFKDIYEMGRAADIEELVGIGKHHGCCPYYANRKKQEEAEIVLLPYNYIIDPKMRRRYKLDLNDSVVIFDEAHNLESICESNSSAELTSTQLATAIAEMQKALALQVEEDQNVRAEADASTAAFGTEKVNKEKESLNTTEVAKALNKLFQLEEAFESLWKCPALKTVENLEGKAASGEHLLTSLEAAGLDAVSASITTDLLKQVVDYLLLKGEEMPLAEKGDGIERLRDFLLAIFTTHAQEVAAVVGESSVKLADRISPKTIAQNCRLYMKKDGEKTIIKYFCFQASVSMRMLKMRGVRNVILASGTLSPMANFTEVMGLNFGATLENMHAVKDVPVITSIVTKGLHSSLSGTYANRNNDVYKMEVGESLIRVIEKVPQGVLAFFPSYGQMDSFLTSWKQMKRGSCMNTVWERMGQLKEIVIEPRLKEEVAAVRGAYAKGVQSGNGAIMFAVCRGKMSEGIDFCDAESRGVVVVGVPYPPVHDERVVLKRMYLDERLLKNKKSMNSKDWYQIEALRAVNQAIGRVLRHKDDFGAVVLLDSRYSGISQTMFPKWLRRTLKSEELTLMLPRISKFFTDRIEAIEVSKKNYAPFSVTSQKKERQNARVKQQDRDVITASELFADADLEEIVAGTSPKQPSSGFHLPTNEEEMQKRELGTDAPIFRGFSAYVKRPAGQSTPKGAPPRKKILLVKPKSETSEDNAATLELPDFFNESLKIPSSTLLAWLPENKKVAFSCALKGYKTGETSLDQLIPKLQSIFLPERPDLFISCSNFLTRDKVHRQQFLTGIQKLDLKF
ncbi:unnamed protein product [Caenorhabditis auriculariae]|uniref:Helicase ATP-binding domain-containing protein n=1 Tax=Caenorhabditis auriculariae TaxID=2777116 RepID=A0A8S1HIC9_9PELO|nr:unnamed protein product [Caenorhabditis auriculariae]